MENEVLRPTSPLARITGICIGIAFIALIMMVMIERAVPRQLTLAEQVHRAPIGCVDAVGTDYFLIKHCSQCATDSDGSVWCRHTETIEF